MKKSFLTLFILLLVISFFPLACHKTNDIVIPPKEEVKAPEDGGISFQPKEGWGCVTCKDENTTSTVKDLRGKVMSIWRPANNQEGREVYYAIDIATSDYDIDSWKITDSVSDSMLIPCPALPKQWQKANLKVLVSGNVKNCRDIVPDVVAKWFYGRKFG